MADLVLILGGARSGKSRFAQTLAQRLGGDDVLFVATAEAGDDEMARRIAHHRQSRPTTWQTLEIPVNVGEQLATIPEARTVVIDCLTLLVSNLLCHEGDDLPFEKAQTLVQREVHALSQAFGSRQGTVILVSGEVGLGVVPQAYLGRIFRDLLGWANQELAAQAQSVYWLMAGIPVELKALQAALAVIPIH